MNKHRLAALLLALAVSVLFGGCVAYNSYERNDSSLPALSVMTEEATTEVTAVSTTESLTELETETETERETETETEQETDAAPATEPTTAIPDELPSDEPLPASVEKNGSYTSPEDVAEYIHTFGTLPQNYLTKKEAQKLGWDSSAGNLWDVAPGMSIGGDRFGNREGLLPDGNYTECDVNYAGGYRGAERLIFGEDGSIYYTNDHYKSFTQLY